MKIKHAVSVASFLGGLLYSGLSFAQDPPGISQPGAARSSILNFEACPPTKPKVYGTNPACQRVKGLDFYCMPQKVAEAMGLTPLSWESYSNTKAGACPGKSMCAGPVRNISELETSVADFQAKLNTAQARISELEAIHTDALADYDQFMLGLKESEPCKKAYAGLEEKLKSVKDNFKAIEGVKEQLRGVLEPTTAQALEEATPAQALQGISAPAEMPIGNLTEQLDAKIKLYEQSKRSLDEEKARLLNEGCGQTTIVKGDGHFVVSPFVQYAFSADAENQGRLGVFAGYQTGRWTFGARAAAILQYEDIDSDTDKSNVQTTALPGGVEKTTSDITQTTIEEKDYAAVGPAVSYSMGRVELGAGVDALVGQRRTTEEYTGYLELTKDGQTLDGKKQVDDSTTETETRFGVYPHVNFDVRLWKQLYGGLESGYNTRSDSAQGAFELEYRF